MIYVIKSLGLKNQDKDITPDNIIEIIKIGYTEDSNLEKRMSAYSTHNKIYKILLKISEGTQEDEHNLHQYFKNFKYDTEWFVDKDDNIEKFFKENNTIELIRSKIPKTGGRAVVGFMREVWKRLNLIFPINSIDDYREVSTLKESIIKELSDTQIYDIDGFYKWMSDKNIKEFDRELIEEKLSKPLSDEGIKFFGDYNALSNLFSKLKYLCEFKFSTEESKQNILNSITEKHFREYYETLGPDGCRSLGYNITKINKKLNIKSFNKSQLVLEIFQNFIEGSRYSNREVKDTLKTIYETSGYEATPKATDLNEYFEIKEISIKERQEDGKYKSSRGLEIIKKKY